MADKHTAPEGAKKPNILVRLLALLVTAALVLGAVYPFTDSSDKDAKYRIANLAKDFCARFKEKYGTLTCTQLLERTAGEEKRYRYCIDYVRDCAELLEQMMAEQAAD